VTPAFGRGALPSWRLRRCPRRSVDRLRQSWRPTNSYRPVDYSFAAWQNAILPALRASHILSGCFRCTNPGTGRSPIPYLESGWLLVQYTIETTMWSRPEEEPECLRHSAMAALLGLVLVVAFRARRNDHHIKVAELDCPTGDAMFPAVRGSDQSTQLSPATRQTMFETSLRCPRCLARSRHKMTQPTRLLSALTNAKRSWTMVRTKGAS